MSLLGASEPRPRIPPLGEAAALVGEAVSHRSALAAVELAEARSHALVSALLFCLAAMLALLGTLTLTLILAALAWDSPHRTWWLAGLGTVHLGGAVLTGLLLRRRLQSWEPLAEIRHQLRLDHRCLSQIIKSILP